MSTNKSEVTTTATKCVPCGSLDKSMLLSLDEVKDSVASTIPKWSINSSGAFLTISRSLKSKNFKKGIEFFNEVCRVAEREGHHPDVSLSSYRNVNVSLYTHSVGGVTKNDLALATMIEEELILVHGKKWFRDEDA